MAASALDKDHSKVHEQVVRFKLAIDQDTKKLSPQAVEIIKSEFTLLPASISIEKYNDEYLAKNKDSPRRTLSALKIRKLLSPDSVASLQNDAANVIKLAAITLEEAEEAFELLRSWNSSNIDSFRSQAATKWPKARVFQTSN